MTPEQEAHFQQAREGMFKFFEELRTFLERFAEKIAPMLQDIKDMFWKGYREVGMPYGDNDEGMWQWAYEWAEEQAAIRQAAYEAERKRTLVWPRFYFVKVRF